MLEWNYKKGYVDLSMPGYIERALKRFAHAPITKNCNSPRKFTPPIYGQHAPQMEKIDILPILEKTHITRIQQVVGTFFYYARAVDTTMLHSLNEISIVQTCATDNTANATIHLLNYAATHPNAVLRFYRSKMILRGHSDASYLCAPKARSRVGGYFYLGKDEKRVSDNFQNGPLLTPCVVMKHVMSSAAEAEMGVAFHNTKEAVALRTTLAELGHPQPPTPIQVDNSTAAGITNRTIRQRRTK